MIRPLTQTLDAVAPRIFQKSFHTDKGAGKAVSRYKTGHKEQPWTALPLIGLILIFIQRFFAFLNVESHHGIWFGSNYFLGSLKMLRAIYIFIIRAKWVFFKRKIERLGLFLVDLWTFQFKKFFFRERSEITLACLHTTCELQLNQG